MTNDEKAKIILKKLAESVQINWTWEDEYLRKIKLGLKEIENAEKLDKQL